MVGVFVKCVRCFFRFLLRLMILCEVSVVFVCVICALDVCFGVVCNFVCECFCACLLSLYMCDI